MDASTVFFTALPPVGDYPDVVLDKLMDDAIEEAKKIVGECNERWKGELRLVFNGGAYKEEHIINLSLDILEEELATDYYYKPVIGSGTGILTYTSSGYPLSPPSSCNSVTDTFHEKILLEGKIDVRTDIAKLKVIVLTPEEYQRKQVIMCRGSDIVNYGFHNVASGSSKDICKIFPTKNAFIEPGIPSQWTFTVDLKKGNPTYTKEGIFASENTNYKIIIHSPKPFERVNLFTHDPSNLVGKSNNNIEKR